MLMEFKSLHILTDDERHVLDGWASGKSNVRIATDCHMSERTVQSILSRLRKMYDDVQLFSPILPPRKA